MAISLQKGQSVNLARLSYVKMGLSWDQVQENKGFFKSLFSSKRSPEIDLDASCLLFDANRNLVDTVWYGKLESKDGSVVHSGDNRTGRGDGDDEVISIQLDKLSENVVSLVFTVTSFSGQTFDKVENAVCRLTNADTGEELVRFELKDKGSHTGVIMATLICKDYRWTMKAIGSSTTGNTVQGLVYCAIQSITQSI